MDRQSTKALDQLLVHRIWLAVSGVKMELVVSCLPWSNDGDILVESVYDGCCRSEEYGYVCTACMFLQVAGSVRVNGCLPRRHGNGVWFDIEEEGSRSRLIILYY